MTKKHSNKTVLMGLIIGLATLFAIPGWRNAMAAVAPGDSGGGGGPIRVVAPAASVNGDPSVLDSHRRLALGMIETGNRDDEIGGAGEVSRYQIMPSVWREYSRSQNYRNPDVSLSVAQKHWARLYAGFIRQAHREPTDFDMYVLWNTHYGYYASRGFNPNRLASVVRDRAQRYVNLVECGDL